MGEPLKTTDISQLRQKFPRGFMIIFTSSCSPIITEINFIKIIIPQKSTFHAMTQSVVVGRNFQ